MCVIVAKYFKDIGWVSAKNRDRSYKPTIEIKQSHRNNIERCLLWDQDTKWTEGVNEFGVALLNTTMKVCKDEKEGDESNKPEIFYSPTGKSVRTALLEKTSKDALNKLIELEMEGFCFILSKDDSYLLEAPSYIDDPDSEYEFKFIKMDKKKVYVRSNHGILFPDAGYPIESDDESMIVSRKGSESRYDIATKAMKDVVEPLDLLKALSQQPSDDLQMNPLRTSKTHGSHTMVTTGQLLVIPSENTLHYRPIWCEFELDFIKLDKSDSKTWFEVISSRKMATIRLESIMTFKEYWDTII